MNLFVFEIFLYLVMNQICIRALYVYLCDQLKRILSSCFIWMDFFFSYLHSLHIQRFIYFLKVILLFSQVTRNLSQICYLFNHSFYIFWWFSEFNHQKSVKIRILTRSTSIYIIFSFFLVIIFSFLCATSFVISTVNILLRDKCQ